MNNYTTFFPKLDQIDMDYKRIKQIGFIGKYPLSQNLFNSFLLVHYQNFLQLQNDLYTNGLFFPRHEFEVPITRKHIRLPIINQFGQETYFNFYYLSIKPFFIKCDDIFDIIFLKRVLTNQNNAQYYNETINSIIEQPVFQFQTPNINEYFQLITLKLQLKQKDEKIYSEQNFVTYPLTIDDQHYDTIKNQIDLSLEDKYNILLNFVDLGNEQGYEYYLRNDLFMVQPRVGNVFSQKDLGQTQNENVINGIYYNIFIQVMKIKIESILTITPLGQLKMEKIQNLLDFVPIYPEMKQKLKEKVLN